MAQITESGGKRSLNPEVNLVPFIDLLSCCICFLLIAAVWLQVGSVQVKQALGTEAPDTPKNTYELVVSLEGPFTAKVQLMKGKGEVAQAVVTGETKEEFAVAMAEQLDQTLASLNLTLAPKDGPKIADVITSGTVNPMKDAPYSSLIVAMDALRKHQIVNLAVTPKAG